MSFVDELYIFPFRSIWL